jgi:CDP-glycerol glycerophosphotransferase (TagB/SpsB family)
MAAFFRHRARRFILTRLFRLLGRLIPVKRGRVVLVYHNRSGSNTLALMEHVPGELGAQAEVLLVRLDGRDGLRERLRKLRLCASARLVVTTHRLVAGDLQDFGKPGQISLELWHGFPLKGLTLMEPSLKPREKRAVAAGWAMAGRIASYSPLYTLVMNACFGVDINQYVVTGAPRNDWLFDGRGRTLQERTLGLPFGSDRVVLFMPTFRSRGLGKTDGTQRQGHFLAFDGFDPSRFVRFLERESLHFVMKIHPVEEAEWAPALQRQGGRVHLLTDPMLERQGLDLYQLLDGVDALVTDYSGVALDYLLLDRPLVFTPVDLEAYRNSRNLVLQPYDFWTPGPKALTQGAFQDELTRSLAEPAYYRAERARIRGLVHALPDGQSSRRVWALIQSVLQGGAAPRSG